MDFWLIMWGGLAAAVVVGGLALLVCWWLDKNWKW